MRRAWRVLRGMGIAVAAMLLLICGTAGFVVWRTMPGGDMQAAIPGLHAPVTVSIDADGVPRIRAADATDAAAALGFVHARARLFQMELMRRAAAGRLSELFGPATLPYDRFMRTLGLARVAAAEWQTMPATPRAVLEAYARGVNAWIGRRGRLSSLPSVVFGRPQPWTPVDSLLWGKTMAVYLSGNWRTELARLALARRMTPEQIDALWPAEPATSVQAALSPDARLASLATRLAAALPRFPDPFTLPAEASNAWAVDGRHSASGAPLLAGDPHLGFSLPGVWFLARIDITEPAATLAGATAPGVPMLVLGHNRTIAWSFTTTGADTQDLFIEQPAGPGRYRTPSGPMPFTLRDEVIHVRGGQDQVLHVRATRHGPVVSDLIDPDGPVLALAAANLQPGDAQAAGLLALNQARSVAEAAEAARRITSPVQNLMVADRQAIGLFVTGRVPVRAAGDGSRPQSGADGAHDWTGFASGDQLPHVVSPQAGVLLNANERIDLPGTAYLGRDWYADFRARRIGALLAAPHRFTAADFSEMQTDTISTFAQDVLPRLQRVAPARAQDAAALRLLDGWGGGARIDAPQPLLFNAWIRDFAGAILDRLHVPPEEGEAAAPWPDLAARALSDEAGLCGAGCDELLQSSLSTAVDTLAARYGRDPTGWRWGVAHPALFADPLLRAVPWLGRLLDGRIAAPGDDTTIDRGGFRAGDFVAVHGASFRAAYDLADLDHARFMVAPGQSGDPLSPLSKNFLRRWRDGATIMLGSGSLGADSGAGDTHIRLVPDGGR